ncbi:hypothetical protein [Gilvimarinus polysaccharolyticus]|uniref:hypothetical protein n=1 Tax=Gilvimarinus polysaccharolyticus TaxID=863921 RepID=UPI000673BD35|nr:hypothetical protein [Gilvimarinus polysaccharolyticus]
MATTLTVEPVSRLSAKPGLPVTLLNPRQGIDVGVGSQVDLSLMSQLVDGYLDVRITLSEGLTLIEGELTQNRSIDNAKLVPMSLVLRADMAGKYYVNMEIVNPEQLQGVNRRALAVTVIAGGEVNKALKTETENDPEQHILPAQETTR